MKAQERLKGASDPSNDRSLHAEVRELLDEWFDDPGDRAVVEEKANALIDKVSTNPLADYVVGVAIDGMIETYRRTAPEEISR